MPRACIVFLFLGSIASGQETNFGPVKVSFVERVDKLKIWNRKNNNVSFLVTDEKYLAVKVRIENSEPTKLIRFSGWSFDGKNRHLCAWATDEFGNRYRCFSFGRDSNVPIIDLVAKSTQLEAGSSARIEAPGTLSTSTQPRISLGLVGFRRRRHC